MAVFEFVRPERFIAGTVGLPGSREFFVQVREAGRTEAAKLEKQQLALLAERVEELLDEVNADVDLLPARVDNDPLDMPVEAMFTVGSMSASWDPKTREIALEFHDLESDLAGSPDLQTLRIVLTAPSAREFVRRSLALVAAGRRPCPLCGEPLNPEGHVCPRANGYRRS